MTPPVHCDHECVCGIVVLTDDEPCKGKIFGHICKHDTRSSRPAPSPDVRIREMIKAEQDNQTCFIITEDEAMNIAYLRWRGAYNDHVWIVSDKLRQQQRQEQKK